MTTVRSRPAVTLADGRRLALREAPACPPGPPARSRVAYAAAHVVADPAGDNRPGAPAVLDWDATLAFRHHLWSHGLGVADAMDTAQRGMGLDWAATAELVRRSAAEAASVGGRIVCGAGTDQLPAGPATIEQVVAAWTEQLDLVEGAGSGVVLMASRQLAAVARGPEDYLEVYGRLLRQVRRPVVLHWLGAVFDPALAGYWGHAEPVDALDVVVALVTEHAAAVDGIKVSVLDADVEIALRRRLPAGVRLYTGDDFHYPELIAGDEQGHSDALLGVLAAIGPVAATALRRLDDDDRRRVRGAARPDRAARPAPVLRAHPALQGRHRVPRLAQRAPARLHHGRRAAGRAQRRAPGPHRSSWPTRPVR